MAEVFLDTAYAIALSSPNDLYHPRAIELADRIETGGLRLVTTRAALLDIGNALSKQRYREAALRLLDALEADPTVEIMSLTESLYLQSLELFRKRADKDCGLTDCISFVVMQERGISEALTTDEYFQQAGFRALMRQSPA